MRYFLLDKITAFEAGKRACGVKCVTLSDEILHDHFPDHPILPGALLIESMSQLGGFLVELSFNTQAGGSVRRAVLAQIKDAKFHHGCKPGDRIELEALLQSQWEGANGLREKLGITMRTWDTTCEVAVTPRLSPRQAHNAKTQKRTSR